MAHGRLDAEAFTTTEAVYVWSITLRLCCGPILNARWRAEDQPQVDVAE